MGFCEGTAGIWNVVGNILTIFKIVIPILLIIWGMIDLGKAVVSSKPDEIKNANKSLLMRAIAAVVIFLIPQIVSVLFIILGSFGTEVQEDFEICSQCITGSDKCDAYAEALTE